MSVRKSWKQELPIYRMSLLPPPTPSSRDYSKEEDSDSDVSEDSAGLNYSLDINTTMTGFN